MRFKRLGFEFRMKLASQEKRMVWESLRSQHKRIRGGACKSQTAPRKQRFVLSIELIPMPMFAR